MSDLWLEEKIDKFQRELVKNQEARDYLESRGFDQETIKNWKLGYAPLDDASLMVGRLTIPITNCYSELIGIGGRLLPRAIQERKDRGEKVGDKYVNTPFQKSHHLFGLDKAIYGIREYGYAIILEDYFGVIAGHQKGLNNCVSVLGAYLSDVHLGLLLRETDKIVVCFDGDEGGHKGVQIAKNLSEKYQVEMFYYPLEEDMDELVYKLTVDQIDGTLRQLFDKKDSLDSWWDSLKQDLELAVK